jgi:hypothetical protein
MEAMSEWIKHLARQIQEKDREAAENIKAGERRQHIINEKGPLFYRETIGALDRDIKSLTEDLAGDITSFPTTVQAQGDAGVPNVPVYIARQACPAVSANLNLQLSQERISLSYLKVNPGPIAEGQEHQYLSVIFRFEVGEYDGPYLVVPFGENSKTLHTPDQLAQYIMELLFIV